MPDESNNASPTRLRRYRWELLHHALLAATIASILFALGTWPGFRSFDLALRAFVAQIQSLKDVLAREALGRQGFVSTFSPNAAGDRPLVLLARNPGGQSEYRSQSVTRFFADLIVELTYAKPGLLAIDLALDPAIDARLVAEGPPVAPLPSTFDAFMRRLPGEPPALEFPRARPPEEQALEDRRQLQNAIRDAAKSFPVVVTAPPFRWRDANDFRRWAAIAPPAEHRLFLRSIDWLMEVCRMPNVWVAMFIPVPETVQTYSPTQETLGNVAANVVAKGEKPPGRTRICSALDEFLRTSGSVPDYALLVERMAELATPAMNEEPAILNPKFFETTSVLGAVRCTQRKARGFARRHHAARVEGKARVRRRRYHLPPLARQSVGAGRGHRGRDLLQQPQSGTRGAAHDRVRGRSRIRDIARGAVHVRLGPIREGG